MSGIKDFFYTEKKTDNPITRHQSFMGGFITTHKVQDEFGVHSDKVIKFLNIPLVKRTEFENIRKWYIFGLKVREKSVAKDFQNKCLKLSDKKYDIVFYLNSNSGETFLFLTYIMDCLIKKNNSKNPFIIATKPYHTELIKMICPEIPYKLVKRRTRVININDFSCENKNFYIIFPHKYFVQVELDIKNNPIGSKHFFDLMLERFDIKREDLHKREISIPEEIKKSAFEKAKASGLNLDKFIFIAPEAISCEPPSKEFWKEIINKYKNDGFDIYMNITDRASNIENADYKTCDLTFSEAFALSTKAEKIIMLRSGLTELIIQSGVETDIFYTKFKQRYQFNDMCVERVMSGFGIMKIPDIPNNKIHEYNLETVIGNKHE